jgi:transposase-like protein
VSLAEVVHQFLFQGAGSDQCILRPPFRCSRHHRELELSVSSKDCPALAADLKLIYPAAPESEAEDSLTAFAERWDASYPMITRSGKQTGHCGSNVLSLRDEMHKAIYKTNAIESLNMSLRKLIKTRASFPSDEAAFSSCNWCCGRCRRNGRY